MATWPGNTFLGNKPDVDRIRLVKIDLAKAVDTGLNFIGGIHCLSITLSGARLGPILVLALGDAALPGTADFCDVDDRLDPVPGGA